MKQPNKRRLGALLSMAIVAALSLRGLLNPLTLWESSEDEWQWVDMFDDQRFLSESELSEFPFYVYPGESDYNAAYAAAAVEVLAPPPPEPIHPYTLKDALDESKMFAYTFAVLIYNPEEDNFLTLYNKKHAWKKSTHKLLASVRALVDMLRLTFPDRFHKDAPELAIAMGSGDYPHVLKTHLPYTTGKAPVLEFGSSFREKKMFPNMITMPMPAREHLACFLTFAAQHGTICNELKAEKSTHHGKLTFGDEFGLKWDGLIPQVVWRGTDFKYLQTLRPKHPVLGAPRVNNYPSLKTEGEGKFANIVAELSDKNNYKQMPPRWKGAVLTAQADLEAQGTDRIPWANMKLSAYMNRGKKPTHKAKKYQAWEKNGIGIGRSIWRSDLAKYKYQIDLGGGGGTTWSGTIEKLAMPGLLFHHMTPTKDYIHDLLTPWKHFIPVMEDLSDLKEKFDWAENHPEEAKSIADAATTFVRHLGKKDGFKKMFEEVFVEPMKRVFEAYQPVSTVHPEMTSWREYMATDDRFVQIFECKGIKKRTCHHSIHLKREKTWQKTGGYPEKKKK